MKNRMKQSLAQELRNMHVSSELKKRILAEAAISRVPQRKKHMSVMPLAAAAAVVLVIGLAAGITMLRSEKPDLSATPLSAAATQPAKEVVWVSDGDGLYHWEVACSSMTDPHSMTPEKARAEGRKACSECLREGGSEAEALVWITNFSNYYHAQHDCSGMTGAVGVLEIEAKTLGRKPCQMCIAAGEVYYDPEIAATLEPSMIAVPLEEGVEVAYTAATPQSFALEIPRFTWSPATAEPTPTPMPTQKPAATAEPVEWVMPTPMATVEPTPMPENVEIMSVWMIDGGAYYHADEHCSGMNGAKNCGESEADAAGKKPCPVCMAMPAAEVTVLSTEEPEHEEAAASSVAVTMDEEGRVSVWMTDGGVYYHVDEHCSGMEGAHVCTEEEAAKAGKILCMVCMPVEEASSEVIYDAEEMSVWMTDGGVYYHTLQDCSGMKNAVGRSVTEALAAGKLPCPKCAKQLRCVWATENGAYYHLNEDCSGMTGAQEISESDAVAQGKTICPDCRQEIVEAAIATTKQHHLEEKYHDH